MRKFKGFATICVFCSRVFFLSGVAFGVQRKCRSLILADGTMTECMSKATATRHKKIREKYPGAPSLNVTRTQRDTLSAKPVYRAPKPRDPTQTFHFEVAPFLAGVAGAFLAGTAGAAVQKALAHVELVRGCLISPPSLVG